MPPLFPPMSRLLSIIQNFAPLFIGLALLSYLSFLLTDLYRSRSELQRSSRARLLEDADKRSQALSYFFSERMNDLQELAANRELSAYFENKALGMSMEYGLAASLEEANTVFETFRKKRQIGKVELYKRMVFLDAAGHKLLDVHDNGVEHHKGEEREWKIYTGEKDDSAQFFASGENDSSSIVISIPYIFKERKSGNILVWLSPADIHHNFLAGSGKKSNLMALLFRKSYLYTFIDSDDIMTRNDLPLANNLREREPIHFLVPIPKRESLEMTAFRLSLIHI